VIVAVLAVSFSNATSARLVVDQSDLAEVVTGTELATLLSVYVDARRPFADHEEADAGLAFGRHRVACLERPLLHGRGDAPQFLPVQVGEDRDALQKVGRRRCHARTMPH